MLIRPRNPQNREKRLALAAEMKQRYQAGEGLRAISEATHVPLASVHYTLAKQGVQFRKQGTSGARKKEALRTIREMRQAGKSWRAIGRALGRTYSAVFTMHRRWEELVLQDEERSQPASAR